VTLDGGEVLAPAGALEDLARGTLRVLHDASFEDDPTRVMRLARYAHRTGLSVDPDTAGLAAAASLDAVSGARIGAELLQIVGEPDPLAVLADLQTKLPLAVERALTQRALDLAPEDADRGLLTLAASIRDGAADEAWIESLELGAYARDVLSAASLAPALARALAAASLPSRMQSILQGVPVEVVAIAGAYGPASAVERWLTDLRHVALEIGGDELLAAGVPEGPELGARLERTLARKLDGLVAPGREAELASALEEER
jgi:tRNA nucleotidyltransferase (CCA-adding enzyme)